jgi:hypothetical protein
LLGRGEKVVKILAAWKANGEGASLAGFALHAQVSTMRYYDVFDDREDLPGGASVRIGGASDVWRMAELLGELEASGC